MASDDKLENDLIPSEEDEKMAREELENATDYAGDVRDTSGKRPSILLGILFLGIILLTLGFGYLYSGKVESQETEITALNSQIANLEMQIRVEEQRGDKRKEELRKIKETLTSPQYRILWSRVISEIENITYGTVVKSDNKAIYNFNGYSLSEKGTIPLSGFTNSYSAIADLIEEFENSDKFTDVRFTSSSKSTTPDGQERASLSLSFKLGENAFHEHIPSIVTEVIPPDSSGEI